MADFINKKTVVTKKPQITVDPGLPPGDYVFELVAVTVDGKRLNPVSVKVQIASSTKTDAFIRPPRRKRRSRRPLR